jgi:hypothetical protein
MKLIIKDEPIDQDVKDSLENNVPIIIVKNYPKEWDDENI